MGLETALLTAQIGATIGGGFLEYREQKKADKAAKRAAIEEAELLEEDKAREALEERRIAEKARKKQKLAFLKSGVVIDDSPLLILEETRARGIESAKAIEEGGKRRAELIRRGAVGRASLLGTTLGVVSGVAGPIRGVLRERREAERRKKEEAKKRG